MGQVGNKLRRTGASDGYTNGGYGHWCPACEEMHAFATDGPQRNGAQWRFDGNLDAPSFSPSMNITIGPDPETGAVERCHYFVRAGQIEYCGDSTHALSGKTVPLPDLPEHLKD